MSVVITFVFKKYKMTLLLQNAFTVTIIRQKDLHCACVYSAQIRCDLQGKV